MAPVTIGIDIGQQRARTAIARSARGNVGDETTAYDWSQESA